MSFVVTEPWAQRSVWSAREMVWSEISLGSEYGM